MVEVEGEQVVCREGSPGKGVGQDDISRDRSVKLKKSSCSVKLTDGRRKYEAPR